MTQVHCIFADYGHSRGATVKIKVFVLTFSNNSIDIRFMLCTNDFDYYLLLDRRAYYNETSKVRVQVESVPWCQTEFTLVLYVNLFNLCTTEMVI